MSFPIRRALLLGGAAFAGFHGLPVAPALAQQAATTLPEVTVTAPSPIVRRHTAPAPRPAPRVAAPAR
ncbi:hypothetical protein NML43_22170, partial [Rhodopseudomonas palustris]|uniref:hypothetical protein n=1 Tax=Rhodopseudomonas palustris TaxID=1076 RepID=UPI0020CC8875